LRFEIDEEVGAGHSHPVGEYEHCLT